MWSVWSVLILSLAVSGIRSDDVRRTTVCEGGEQKIDCQGDQKLEIVSADFGRWDRGVCKGFLDMDWHTNCHTPKALEITKKECDGLSSCVLHAKVSEYGDPCVTIKKYLTVSYRCVRSKPSNEERVRVCERDRHAIECPNKRKIKIVSANYGRSKGSHICAGVVLTTTCTSSVSLPVVKYDCHNKQHCDLVATNEKFGGCDPCPHTKKYLEVTYRCEK